jgi:DNA-binding NtrC family response regulator
VSGNASFTGFLEGMFRTLCQDDPDDLKSRTVNGIVMAQLVLVVDDDPVQRRLVEAALTRFGHEVVVAEGGEAGLAVLDGARGRDVALVILDLVMPGMDGLGMLAAMRERGIELPVIVQTAMGGIDTVINAMRAGAFDFVVKPASPDRLQVAVASALKVGARGGGTVRGPRNASGLTFRDIVTRSDAMARVMRLGQKAAASHIPILIEGESGVGKELVARAIQGSGERSGKPFVTVNCGAIPDNLVESILFGHEKGAFTGATEKHPGKFVEADGGTLFLDEIGDLPLDVQVKLLRAVQEGEIETVGARTSRKVDIRLISATHRDLLQRVRTGEFREDLFYRLNVFPIHVPPLRERREDIPDLVAHFVRRFCEEEHRRPLRVSPDALAMLSVYDWPGNIRQLENAVFRAVVLCEGDMLTTDEFPQIKAQVQGIDLSRHVPAEIGPNGEQEEIATSDAAVPQGFAEAAGASGILRAIDERGNVRSLAEVEVEMIRLAIQHYGGQMSEVARRLGIGRSTLYRKLKEYGIDPEAGRGDRLAS